MKKIKVSEFKPRKTAPLENDPLYIMKKYGGKSPCIQGQPVLKKGWILPNCVGYAYARTWEICGEEVHIGTSKGLDYPQSAQYWWDRNDGLKRGKEPKVGAVACWHYANYKIGHVAIVEEVKADKSIVVSESLYGYKDIPFRLRTIKYPYNYGNEIFSGFIYNPSIIDDHVQTEPVEELKIGDKVKITKKGNARADGTGWEAKGVGWTRYILAIHNGAKYPYQVGNSTGTTGFYTKEGIRKL